MATNSPFLQSPYQALIQEQERERAAQLLPGNDPVQEAELPELEASAPEPKPQPARSAIPQKPASLVPPAEMRDLFEATASHYQVPVNVLMAIAQQESSYNADAENAESGAKGMVQYISATAKSLGINAADPNEAIPAAAYQLRQRLDKGLSMDDAVREHFAGPDRKLWGPKTAAYGDEVMKKAGLIGDELYGKIERPQAEPATADSAPLPNFGINPDALKRIQAQWNAATPEERVQMESIRGPRGYIAKELNKRHPTKQPAPNPLGLEVDPMAQVNDAYKNPTLDSIDPRAEARARNLVNQGMEGNTANKVARAAALAGMAPGTEPGIGQRIENTDFDFAARKKYQEDPFFSNPAVRGAVKGIEGYKRGLIGLGQFAADVTGADNVAGGLAESAKESREAEAAMGDADNYAQRQFEGAVSSIAQQVPALVGGVVTGSEALVLGTMFAQTFGSEYGEGRARGQNPEQAIGRAALYGTFEVVGEKLGLGDTLKGLRGAVAGETTKEVATSMARALLKEIPGEQLTTLGQFGTDKLGGGYGLNTEAGLAEYLQQAADTAVQTIIQGGIMGGAAAGASAALNRARPEQMPQQERIEPSLQPEAQDLQPAAQSMQPSAPEQAQAAPAEEETPFTAQIMGDDGVMRTLDMGQGVIEPEAQAEPQGPMETALAEAAAQHAADPAPPPILPEAEPAAPDYTAMPLDDLKARIKEIAAQSKAATEPEQRKKAEAERKMVEKEIGARVKQAKEESKPAEEPLTNGPFEDIKQANRMMMRHIEKTGVPHEVVGKEGAFRIQPLEANDGNERLDSAGDSGRPDGLAGSGATAAGVGNGDGVRSEGAGSEPVERAGNDGQRVHDIRPDPAAANVPADAQQALSEPAKNPYAAYSASKKEVAEAYMDKRGIDKAKFEVVQVGPVKWQVGPRAAQVPNVTEDQADVSQRQEVPEEAQAPSGSESAESPAASVRPEGTDAAAGTSAAPAKPKRKVNESVARRQAANAKQEEAVAKAVASLAARKAAQGRNSIDELMAMEEDAGEGFKKNDRAIAIIQKASNGFLPAEKAKLTRAINKYTKTERDGTRLVDPRLYEEVANQFAGVGYLLRDAIDETVEPQQAAAEQPPAPTQQDSKPKRKPAAKKDEPVKSAAEWADEMTQLRKVKPRAIERVYGQSPTDEQRAAHSAAEKEWNRKYRHASKMQKETLERENAEYFARQKAAKAAEPVEEAEGVRYSVSEESDTDYSLLDLPMLADSLPVLDSFVMALANAGIVKLHADSSTLPVKGKAPQGVQALTTASGEIHLVAANLNNNAKGIVLHEAFHANVKGLIGTKVWDDLMARLASLHKQGQQTTGAANAFWQQAKRRVLIAQLKGAVAPGMEAEEFGAYAIEEYANAPLTVRKWVDDLVGAIKAWVLRRFGAQIGEVTPAQLMALAKAALMDVQTSRQQAAFSVSGSLPAGAAPVEADEAQATRSLTPAEQNILQKLQANVQDSQNRIKQVQERIRKSFGVKDLGTADHYLAETNRPGRIAARKEDARDKLIEPMVKRLEKAGYTMPQLSELLHAQHAEERNAAVAAINPEFPDGGSGLTNAQAQEILKRYENEGDLLRLADEARNIARATLDLKLEYGLITKAQHESLSISYDNYVPLKGDGEYGPKVKRAMGHGEREEHILENIVRDYEQAVVVGEKNLARQSLLQMVLQFADDALWTARVPPRGRYVAGTVFNISRKGTGDIEASFTSQSQVAAWLEAKGSEAAQYEVNTLGGEQVAEFTRPLQDNEVMVYVKGDPVRIQIYDEALARQLRPLKGEQMNVVLELMRKHNRYLSMIFTGYNPAFIFKNATRDAITGTINMTGNHGIATAAKAWTKYPMAWATMLKWAATKKVPDTAMGRMLTEYRSQGGKVGASYMSDLEEQGKNLQRMFDDAKGVSGYAAEGKVGKAAWIAARKAIGGLAHAVEVLNQAFENALRLALYAQLRAEGKKPGVAAAGAKTVTVNFDRKGAMTAQLGAFYLFINPAIQGTANMGRTLTAGEHKGQAWGMVGMMALAGFAAGAAGMDEDKDRWLGEKWDTRTKNLRIKIGSTTINIPLSQEYAPFYAIGVAMAEASRGESPMRSTVRTLTSFLDAYYPINGALDMDSDAPGVDSVVAHVPTPFKLLAQLMTNRDGFGGETAPESDTTKNRPDNLKMDRRTKGSVYDSVAQAIASDDYTNDLSKVSPETLKLIWSTYTGGLGRFIADSVGAGDLARQAEVDVQVSDVPIVKDFVKPDNVNPIRSRFYELSSEARTTIDEFAAAKKARDAKAMRAIVEDDEKKAHLGLAKMIQSINKVQSLYADQAADINADKKLSTADKRAKLKEIEAEQEAIYRKAIAAFQK